MSMTIHEIAQAIRVTGEGGKAHKASKSIVDGKVARKPATRIGLVELTPEQILSVVIERQSVNGAVEGYQRDTNVAKVRQMARSVKAGKRLAPPTLGLENGRLYGVDGQHRLLAAIVAWRPMWCVIEVMSKEHRAERFADQRLATRPPADVIVLTLEDPIANYIKSAIEAESNGTEHPLVGIVGPRSNSHHVGAATVYGQLVSYITNQIGSTAAAKAYQALLPHEQRKAWSKDLADEHALLLRCFGPKKSAHPVIYRAPTLRALNDLSVAAIRRSPKKQDDIQRWCNRMPTFDWTGAAWANRHMEIRPILTMWWNKRLPDARKVQF